MRVCAWTVAFGRAIGVAVFGMMGLDTRLRVEEALRLTAVALRTTGRGLAQDDVGDGKLLREGRVTAP